MPIADEIAAKLRAAFDPTELSVAHDSEKHRGHAGYRDGGESHFSVRVRAPALAVMGRVARHRAIHAALGEALIDRIHALALDAG